MNHKNVSEIGHDRQRQRYKTYKASKYDLITDEILKQLQINYFDIVIDHLGW